MSTLIVNLIPLAESVRCSDEELIVALKDGRTVSVPLAWFPRLAHASHKERANYELLGNGEGIHWPSIDEDISVIGLVTGRPSVEYEKRPPQESIVAER